MKIKNVKLTNPIDDSVLKNGDKELNLFWTITDILLSTQSDKPQENYKISVALMKSDSKEIEITPEEIVHIKNVIGKSTGYIPMVTGQVLDLLK